MSVSYWLFQYSVIGDSQSLSWVCHIDSLSTVLLVIPNHCHECVILTLTVQYSVIGDSTLMSWVCHINTLVQCYWWFRVPIMSVSYWLFQYSVIGDSGSCHECVILTLSVQCYWWFTNNTVMSVSYWLFQYSVIGDSGSLSWVCHIDSFSTVLLVIPGHCHWVCDMTHSVTVLLVNHQSLSLSVSYWLTHDSVIGDSNHCHWVCHIWLFQYSVIGIHQSLSLSVSILTLSVQCYWWFQSLSWVCHIDSFSTVLLVIHQGHCPECVILTLSWQCYWWFTNHCHECVILTLSVQCYWWFTGHCHECVILTLSVQCYWWFTGHCHWVCHIDSFSDSVTRWSPITLSLSVSYMTHSVQVTRDSPITCHECVILTLSVQCYWWFTGPVTECVILTLSVQCYWWFTNHCHWVCDINSFSTVLLVIHQSLSLSVSYWLFQYSVIGDSPILSWKCHIDTLTRLGISTVYYWWFRTPVMSVSYWLFH